MRAELKASSIVSTEAGYTAVAASLAQQGGLAGAAAGETAAKFVFFKTVVGKVVIALTTAVVAAGAIIGVQALNQKQPDTVPVAAVTSTPTPEPAETPTPAPTPIPTIEATIVSTEKPTEAPTAEPTIEPSEEPSEEPSPEPSEEPTPSPTATALNEDFAVSSKATIQDADTVIFTAQLPSVPESDDGQLYLYPLQVYEYEIPAGTQPVGQVQMTTEPTISFALNKGKADTRLYSKFVLAVKKEGIITAISKGQFVSNPEILAAHTHARSDGAGLMVGMQGQDFANVYLKSGSRMNPSVIPRIAQIMQETPDSVFTNPYANIADSKPVIKSDYMINANNAAGVSALIDVMEYYAANASRTDDWIVGNEVNVRQWNYMAWVSWDEYMRQYEQVFRIIYIAVKSNNANANVYVCLDQNWDRNRPTSHEEYYHYIDGKDFLQQFSADVKAGGDMKWGVSQHPYTVPLTYAKFWDMSGLAEGAYYSSMITGDKMVSFQNLGVITGFMQSAAMLGPDGAMRPFIISELGISADQGDQVQAAALYASYKAAVRNGHVRSIIYSSVNAGGVNAAFTPAAQDMYNNMNGANAASYEQQAMTTIGISDWGAILR